MLKYVFLSIGLENGNKSPGVLDEKISNNHGNDNQVDHHSQSKAVNAADKSSAEKSPIHRFDIDH